MFKRLLSRGFLGLLACCSVRLGLENVPSFEQCYIGFLEEAQEVVLAFVEQGLGLGKVPSFEQEYW